MNKKNIANLIKFKTEIEKRNIWDVKLPDSTREWSVLSSCNNLDLEFVRKFHDRLSLEQVVTNESLSFREQIAQEYKDNIDWTKVALISAYRLYGTPEGIMNKEKEITYGLLKDNEDKIKWEDMSKRRYFYSINNNFLKEFSSHIKWTELIGNVKNNIDKEIVNDASNKGYINWNEVSSNTSFPENFTRDNYEHINWKEYLKNNSFSSIPIECQNRDNIMEAIRNNPAVLNLIADRSLYASASDYLKNKVWIDRIPDNEVHYADDSTIREEHLLEHHWVDRISEGNSHYNDESEFTTEHIWVDKTPDEETHYNDPEEYIEL